MFDESLNSKDELTNKKYFWLRPQPQKQFSLLVPRCDYLNEFAGQVILEGRVKKR